MLLNFFKFFTLCLLMYSCGKENSKPIILGTTKESELKAIKGEPQISLIKSTDVKVLIYNKDQTAFQIEKNTAVAKFRPPTISEKNIQFWRHKWKNKITNEIKSTSETNNENIHNVNFYQLINKNEKTTIIFDLNNGIVERVIEYEN